MHGRGHVQGQLACMKATDRGGASHLDRASTGQALAPFFSIFWSPWGGVLTVLLVVMISGGGGGGGGGCGCG
jgi:hypothetical protein